MSNKLTIDILENKINNLCGITDLSEKFNEIEKIKIEINNEYNNINNIISNLDKPMNTTKSYDITKIINEFDNVDISKKIKYYHFINNYIQNMESELFNL